MHQAIRAELAARADPLEVFTARAGARAYLWAEGEFDLHEAVDQLQHDALRTGLVAKIGQDAVQSLMSRAFAAVRRPCVVETTEAVPDPIPESTFEPLKDRAPNSTVEAVMYALREYGIAALQNERTRQRIAEISSRQIKGVVVRLSRMRGTYPKVTDDLLLTLAELLDG